MGGICCESVVLPLGVCGKLCGLSGVVMPGVVLSGVVASGDSNGTKGNCPSAGVAGFSVLGAVDVGAGSVELPGTGVMGCVDVGGVSVPCGTVVPGGSGSPFLVLNEFS